MEIPGVASSEENPVIESESEAGQREGYPNSIRVGPPPLLRPAQNPSPRPKNSIRGKKRMGVSKNPYEVNPDIHLTTAERQWGGGVGGGGVVVGALIM